MKEVNKFFQTYRELIIAVSMIAVTIVGIIFGIIPAVDKTIALRDETQSLSTSNNTLQTKLNLLNANDESVYRDQLQELIAAVPTDKSLTTLFSTIDGVSALSGITVSDLTLSNPGSLATGSATKQSNEEKQIGSNLLPFTVTVVGSYDQVHSFLLQVVQVRRFFRVRNFEISFEDMANIIVHIGMDAYYFPLSSSIVSADTPLAPMTQKELDVIATIQKMPVVGQNTLTPSGAAPTIGSPRADLFSP